MKPFFDKQINFKVNQKIMDMASELLEKYPHDYSSKAHVIRAGIISLHKKRVGGKDEHYF